VNIPIWIWYIVGAVIVLLVLANVVLGTFGFRRFRRMESDFNDQRERVRRNLRKGARRT
jgi:hypothetical protein